MKILVTGFDPFGGEPVNPAYESVKLLPDEIAGAEIIKLEIPTVVDKSTAKVVDAIKEHNPDVVLSIGQAGGRFQISMEKVGINLNHFRIKDNEGNQPLDQKIDESGPDAYFTDLPVNAMVKNVKDANIPAAVSYTAGTFVCNHVMYAVCNYVRKNDLKIKTGFIHIPFMTEQVIEKRNMPAMDLNVIARGLEKAIEAIVNNDTDISLAGGNVC